MSILFLEYPKCTTCKKAKAWLEASDVAFADRHIVEENPSAAELGEWWKKSGLPLKKFFNTRKFDDSSICLNSIPRFSAAVNTPAADFHWESGVTASGFPPIRFL